eukprot:900207_1
MVVSMSLSHTMKLLLLTLLLSFLLGVHGVPGNNASGPENAESTEEEKSQLDKSDIEFVKVGSGDTKNQIKLTWPKLEDSNISSYDVKLDVYGSKDGTHHILKSISVKEQKDNDMEYVTDIIEEGLICVLHVRPVWTDEEGRVEDWVAIDPIVIGIDPFFVKLRYDKNGEELNSDKDRELLELMDKKARAYFE